MTHRRGISLDLLTALIYKLRGKNLNFESFVSPINVEIAEAAERRLNCEFPFATAPDNSRKRQKLVIICPSNEPLIIS